MSKERGKNALMLLVIFIVCWSLTIAIALAIARFVSFLISLYESH